MEDGLELNTIYQYDQSPKGFVDDDFYAGTMWAAGNLLYITDATTGVIMSFDLVTRQWAKTGLSLPEGSIFAVNTTIGDITYIYGGYDPSKTDPNDTGNKDIVTFNNRTLEIGVLPSDFPTTSYGFVFAHKDNLYVMSGTNNQSPVPNLFSRYEPTTGKWTSLAERPVRTGPIQVPDFVIDNDIMYVTGAASSFTNAFPMKYSTTYDFNKDQWTDIVTTRTQHRGGKSILIGRKAYTYTYFGGGRTIFVNGGVAVSYDIDTHEETTIPITSKTPNNGFASGWAPSCIYNGFYIMVGNRWGTGKTAPEEEEELPVSKLPTCDVFIMKPAIPK